MSTAFDQIANSYADLWSDTREGRAQRDEIWQVIDAHFAPGDRILDLGCGTGDDALHLGEHGVAVVAIDASVAMVDVARSRGVAAWPLAIEQVSQLRGPFDGALSNFGALNCVADLPAVARNLLPLIVPGGKFALCVLSRFYPREMFTHPRRTLARLRGQTIWRGTRVYYRFRREIVRAFAPHYELLSATPIGGGDHVLYVFRKQ